uniref:BTB domain-containing protein n=1 Tax=Meloidogyne javanica TaxID=6303 RepID=A0A915LN30_MELJA
MISDVLTFESITCKIEWKLYNLDKHGHFLLANHFLSIEFVPYGMKCENEVVDSSPESSSQQSLDMFKEGILTDCVVEIENETINTHKFILAKNSVVFRRMFEQMGMTEAQNGKVKIVDTSPECFKAMLESLYSGEIHEKTIKKHSEDLFAIAHKYQVKQLMEICENYMAANIALNEEKQIEEEKICSNCEQRRNSSRYSPYYHHPSPRFSYLRSPSWNQPSPSYTPLSPSYNQASPTLNEEKQTEKKKVVNPYECPNCEHRRNISDNRLFGHAKPAYSCNLSTQQSAGNQLFGTAQHIQFGAFQ